jgi:hypothetical protein
MNKEERAYARVLEQEERDGLNLGYIYERIKLRLAADTFYTVDFFVFRTIGIECHEVKAFWKKARRVGWEEDARVKIKVAAEQFPWFRFVGVHREAGEWKREDF